ncbi:site-specific DNA-methyltransferase [Candidatus Borrarchaeum sp.]|uniref:site-specific DNA-methyltransferase n=1 Tax=Candidatus Borrarchaeum sp. TaxID=2846742 RepID=UPI00257B16E7|nr:site-specific DNA-methyltransferase [Candidatus Borrarchaeum sp.]
MNNIEKFNRLDGVWTPKAILGDVKKVAKALPENFVDCIITSPPYWMQRDYAHPDQVGREETPEDYVNEIASVFEILAPKLKKTGTIFLNVGYKYLNGEFILIPEMIALEMKKRGFMLKNKLIWFKPNAMPTPARDRFNDVYEPVLYFIRSEGKDVHYFNLEQVSQKAKTFNDYENLLKILPEELIGAKVIDSLSMRKSAEGKVIGVRYISDDPTEVLVIWENNTQEWIPFGKTMKNYPESVNFNCPKCGEVINCWNIRLSFANLGEMVCPEFKSLLCESSETFPTPELENTTKSKAKIQELVDPNTDAKKYITKSPKSSKFLKANMKKTTMASPAGRLAIEGEYLTIKRRWDVPQLLIAKYLRYWKNYTGITIGDIDKKLGYAHTAGHWFRLDFGWWGKGGSIPRPTDWKRLKKLLKFDDIYEKLVTEKVAVLQTVKPHEEGKNPGDVWEIMLEQYPEAHFSIFPTKLVETAMKAGCPLGGVVLDPFAGSGTVGEVAIKLGRKAILIELVPQFLELMKKRFQEQIEIISL